jgi:hypothetical protein
MSLSIPSLLVYLLLLLKELEVLVLVRTEEEEEEEEEEERGDREWSPVLWLPGRPPLGRAFLVPQAGGWTELSCQTRVGACPTLHPKACRIPHPPMTQQQPMRSQGSFRENFEAAEAVVVAVVKKSAAAAAAKMARQLL